VMIIPVMSRFMDSNSGRKVIFRDFVYDPPAASRRS
jgi:hypothetical protein